MNEKRKFTVIIEKDETGYLVADVPELEACHTQGRTMDELIKNIKEVIQLCLEEKGKSYKPEIEFVGVQTVEV
ncbi:MAG: type II toxin-antitoxin system HicB family antitoxin [Candidatus Diapherotrites archaeon]|nr:type II toxin-antitoxin system HicB family antitoxin [Candidatus Diapherotrites archaeon]